MATPDPAPPPPSGSSPPGSLPPGWAPNPQYAPVPPAWSGQPQQGPPGDPGWGYHPDPAWRAWHGSAEQAHPTVLPGTRPGTGQRNGGILGGLLAAVFAFFKYGLVALKFGKFGGTAISMVIAIWVYTLFFGWEFAVGVVLLIFIHEMGHYLTSRFEGVPVKAPLFIPMLGAFTAHAGLENDRRKEAIIAAAGPVFGFLAALLLYLFALSQPVVSHFVSLCFALSYFGFLITLFNLIPMVPLDGGRIAGAISKWANVAGLAAFAGLMLFMAVNDVPTNPFLLIILLFGAFTTWGRFQRARRGEDPPPLPGDAKLWLAVFYVGLIALSALLMSLAHGTLVGTGIVAS